MNLQFKQYHLYFIFLWLSVALSCTSIRPSHEQKTPLPWPHKDKSPALVILPFENTTEEKDLNNIFRQSLANDLSEINYRNLKLSEVDEALAILERSFKEKWQDLSPVTLGKLFRCNYLMYGEATKYKMLFLGVYAQVAIGVHIKLVETVHGTTIWERELVKRAHDGGIPFSLFNIIPEFLRCSMHIKEETKISLVEKACRELAAEIPNPPKPAVSVFIVEIQVASFTDKNRAVKIMKKLKSKGYDAHIEKVMFSNGAWYRIILGPYYDKQEAIISKRRIEKDPRFQPFFIHY
jgi:TolB-like protein